MEAGEAEEEEKKDAGEDPTIEKPTEMRRLEIAESESEESDKEEVVGEVPHTDSQKPTEMRRLEIAESESDGADNEESLRAKAQAPPLDCTAGNAASVELPRTPATNTVQTRAPFDYYS